MFSELFVLAHGEVNQIPCFGNLSIVNIDVHSSVVAIDDRAAQHGHSNGNQEL